MKLVPASQAPVLETEPVPCALHISLLTSCCYRSDHAQVASSSFLGANKLPQSGLIKAGTDTTYDHGIINSRCRRVKMRPIYINGCLQAVIDKRTYHRYLPNIVCSESKSWKGGLVEQRTTQKIKK